MLFDRIESEGLAHYSYIIGDGNEAIVIDPRRDCDVYIEKASQNGLNIIYILETHRNEDYVIGSVELASKTGAEIFHADVQLDYKYGQPVNDGKTWRVGKLKFQAIHTPGHTPGSMSYLLYDPDGVPWIIFTGDTLFAGDVGRVDLVDIDRTREMAGLLYDSLFNKILLLGDNIIVCASHGAGSVCGASIAKRVFTTIGIERHHNPKLQYLERDKFISESAKILERPPYFRYMEKLNTEGATILGSLPNPPSLLPDVFAKKAKDAIILDTRAVLGYGAGHIQDSISIWLDGIPSFAGWFLNYDKPILLVMNETENPIQAVRKLIRLGYDRIEGYLSGGMQSWHSSGKKSVSIKMPLVQELCQQLDRQEDIWLLDVRRDNELMTEGQISGAHHIHITQLPEYKDSVPKDTPVYVFCRTGLRSMIGASFLQKNGWQDVSAVLGGISGWKSIGCPVLKD